MKNEISKPPTILNKVGKEKYYEIINVLKEEDKWKDGDEIALSALCANYQRWIQAEKAIKENKDLCFKTESGYRQQIPEISISKDCMKSMLSFIKEFGLTPAARARIKGILITGNNDDPEMEEMVVK